MDACNHFLTFLSVTMANWSKGLETEREPFDFFVFVWPIIENLTVFIVYKLLDLFHFFA
jgi:hypothetical protein